MLVGDDLVMTGIASDGSTFAGKRIDATGYFVARVARDGALTWFSINPSAKVIELALGPGCSAPAPKYILEYPDSQTCNTGRYRVFAVGAKYTTAYVKSGTSCSATSSSPTYAFYALGAEVPATTFQSATSSVE